MNIIMMGPPGSGKGTQAAKIAEKYNLPHVSTGELFREVAKQDTELGRKTQEVMQSGKLMPDEMTIEMAKEYFSDDGFILDGFPRTIDQAKFLATKYDVNYAIFLEVSDEEVVRRISNRRTCEDCNENYNLIYIPPNDPEKCDACNGKLIQRADQKPEVVRDRMKYYHELIDPLMGFYEEKGVLVKINGEQPIQKVYDDIVKEITAREQ